MLILLFTIFLLFPTAAYADCKIIETEKGVTVECAPDSRQSELKPNLTPSQNFLTDKTCLLAKEEITKSADKFLYLTDINSLEKEFRHMQKVGFDFQSLFVESGEMHGVTCPAHYKYMLKTIAIIQVFYAKKLITADLRPKAKEVLRDLVISFTGSNYKSEVREAEFLLEDLRENKF